MQEIPRQVVGAGRQTDREADRGLSRSAGEAGRQQAFQITGGHRRLRDQVP